jgi:hypothetical protein
MNFFFKNYLQGIDLCLYLHHQNERNYSKLESFKV